MINLLPEKRKENIRLRVLNNFILKIGLVSFMAIWLFILFLIANIFVLNIYKNINQSRVGNKESNEMNAIIQQSKRAIDSQYTESEEVSKNFKSRIPYWEYLNQVNQILPEKVYFTKIEIKENIISIDGFAENRNDLVAFKNSLESVEIFKQVEMPISNFTSQENINFVININLNSTSK